MLKLMKSQTLLGEALKIECPENDCTIYRNLYNRYMDLYNDREVLSGRVNECTIHAIETAMHRVLKDLDDMFFTNYAIACYQKKHRRTS